MSDAWIVPVWPAPANVRALSTTRAGGVGVAACFSALALPPLRPRAAGSLGVVAFAAVFLLAALPFAATLAAPVCLLALAALAAALAAALLVVLLLTLAAAPFFAAAPSASGLPRFVAAGGGGVAGLAAFCSRLAVFFVLALAVDFARGVVDGLARRAM